MFRAPVLRSLPGILAALVLLQVPGTAGAQTTISGRVADLDGNPVPAARVLLVSGASIAANALTAADGAFSLNAPAQGSYELRAFADGLRAAPLPVDATGTNTDVGTIQLQVSAFSEQVVVSAAQVDVPLSATASAVTVLSGDELRLRQYESVADALRAVPGLFVASSGGRGSLTSIFPRGGESDYALVFVDDVQANEFGGGFDAAHLPVSNIDRIEVVRGPQSALYGGNAIGSVIRVVTRRGGSPSVEGSVEGGSFDTFRMSAGTAGDLRGWQWTATTERLASDGLKGQETATGELVSNDQYERAAGAAGLAWSSRTGGTARADVRYSEDERGAPGPFGTDPGGSFFGINTLAAGVNERLLGALGGAVPLGAGMRAHARLSHSRTDGRFRDTFGNSETWSRRTTARVQLDAALAPHLEGSAGAELLRERAGSTFITSNRQPIPVRRSMEGLFAEARWTPGGRLFVTSGVRAERITREPLPPDAAGFANRPELPEDTLTSINPKLAAAYYVRTSGAGFTRVRASAGTGIRPPDAFELAFTDNPGLKPERSRSVDAGLDHAFGGGRVFLESTAFFNNYDDLIIAVGSFRESSRYRTDNISNARSHGLEVAGTYRGRTARADLQVRLGYTVLDTAILAADGAQAAPAPFKVGDRLLRRPTHQVSIDAAVRAGRIGAFIRGGGRSAVRDVDPSLGTFGGTYDAAGYMAWDAGVSSDIARAVEAVFRVTNLFDRRYEETLGYPALGRGVFFGLRVAARR